MRVLYFDCFAGVSGDMIVGALIDLGVGLDELRDGLSALGLSGYEVGADRVKRSQIAATKFNVIVDERAQPARRLADIREIVSNSSLSERVKARAVRVFERLAEAEARAHDEAIDTVHFHEVGAVDSIIDVVGAMISIEALKVERFIASPLRLGRGFVKTEHGLLPVPAPGTAELLRGVPVYGGEMEGEFVTPTGAAIVTTLCESYGELPLVKIERTGYGAGTRDPAGFPNALRAVLCEMADEDAVSTCSDEESVVVIETNIDDMNPQAYEFVMGRAFALGALDFFTTPVVMKKSRPATLLTVLCARANLDPITKMLLAETTTLGIRYTEARRRVLDRVTETVETGYGRVRIKVAREGGRTLHFQPEYEDCARLAEESHAPLLDVQAAALARYREKLAGDDQKEVDGKLEEK